MHRIKYIFSALLALALPLIASATILGAQGGGTGIGTAIAGDVGSCLKVSSFSPLVWATGTCGVGGSGGGSWSTTTSQTAGRLINYPNNNTDIVTIGSNSTTTAKYWFDPNTLNALLGNSNTASTTIMGNATTTGSHSAGYFRGISTATSTFLGGIEGWTLISSPYFFATSTTATSTIRNALQIGTTAGDNALKVDASGRIYPASVSVGGAINCNEGTQGQFPCLVLYGNSGSAGTGRMFSVMQEGTAVTQDMMFASSSGANVTAFNIKGMPTGKGILKIEATGSGTGYANSSAISLDLGNETDAQGIFIKGAVNGTSKLTTWVDSNSSTLGFFDPNGLFNSKYSSSTVYSSFLTASSTFLNAGSFTLATTSAGCASITSAGLLFSTGVACGSGGSGLSSYDAWTHPIVGTSATTSLMNLDGGFIANASSTVAAVFRAFALGLGKAPSSSIRNEILTNSTYTQGTRTEGDAATRLAFSGYVTGDAQVRYTTRIDGLMGWGDGTSVTDTNLYRSAVGTLKTDNTFLAATGLGVATTSPGSLLSVGGDGVGINFGLGTSTWSTTGGINLKTSGCFAINGSCVGAGSFTNTIANGGTGSTSFAPNSIITSNAAGTALIATTSNLYVTSLFATSTTATSTFMGNISLTDGTNYGFVTGAQPLILSGTVNLPYQSIISNKSTGSTAMSGYTLANANTVNNANPFLDTYYAGMYMAGSAFALYPGLQPNDLVTVNSDGNVRLAALSSNVASSSISFSVGPGFTGANYDAIIIASSTTGRAQMGLGTSTPRFPLQISATTTPQLSLSGADTDNAWNMRSIGNQFFLATSSPTTYATSSVAALRIDTNGKVIANCFSTDGTTCLSGTGGAGTVTSVGITSTNSTLTFGSTPITTSGTFTADLNLGHANTWTAAQTFSGGLMVATTTQWMNSIATLVGTTTIQGQINSIFASTTGSATQTINWSSGNTQRIIINASTNIVMNATSSNPIDGGKYVLKICQDPVGSRAITFVTPGQLRWWNGTTTISTAASTCTFIGMIYDDLYQKYSIIASSTGVTLF